MKLEDLLASIRSDVLVEFTGVASQADYNPAAKWVSRICCRELNRRRGEALCAVPPLDLDADAVGFTIEWIDFTAAQFADLGVEQADADLVRLAALIEHVGRLVKLRTASPLQ